MSLKKLGGVFFVSAILATTVSCGKKSDSSSPAAAPNNFADYCGTLNKAGTTATTGTYGEESGCWNVTSIATTDGSTVKPQVGQGAVVIVDFQKGIQYCSFDTSSNKTEYDVLPTSEYFKPNEQDSADTFSDDKNQDVDTAAGFFFPHAKSFTLQRDDGTQVTAAQAHGVCSQLTNAPAIPSTATTK